MFKSVAEIIVAVLLTLITAYLYRQRNRVRPRHRGFELLLAGLTLVTLAAWLDTLEIQRMTSLSPFLRESGEFIELMVGYVTGILLVGAGLSLWVPALARSQREVQERMRVENDLAGFRKELELRNETLQILNDLAGRLQRNLDPDAIARETVDVLLHHSNPPLVAVYLLDPGGRTLHLAADHGFDEETRALGRTLVLAGSLSGRAIAEGRILTSQDIASDGRADTAVRTALGEHGIRSATVVPLMYRDRALGTMNLVYGEPHAEDDRELETLRAIGQSVSLAMANAQHLAELSHLAYNDPLTGLGNRARLGREFAAFLDRTGERAGLILLDLDRFQEVNEALGHQVGDELLTRVAERIERTLAGKAAVVCRLGGDEFAALLLGIRGAAEVEATARHLLAEARRPYEVGRTTLVVGASLGVAVSPDHGHDSASLLRCADVAMYHAKRTASGVVVYAEELDRHTPEKLALVTDLERAVRDGELLLHYQPKFSLTDRSVTGFEALIRWDHPRLGLLPPSAFIPLAEVGDVIHPLTYWVVEHALAQLTPWSAADGRYSMAINLSTRNLLDLGCADRLREIIERSRVDPSRVEFELTETALIRDPETAASVLTHIAATGARLAVDDFGTGYSSLAYLKRLPVSTLKIDRAFVRDMLHDERNFAIVRSTIGLAHSLGLGVVAEGVEDHATGEALREMGCDEAQGYHYSRPGPADAITRLIGQA